MDTFTVDTTIEAWVTPDAVLVLDNETDTSTLFDFSEFVWNSSDS